MSVDQILSSPLRTPTKRTKKAPKQDVVSKDAMMELFMRIIAESIESSLETLKRNLTIELQPPAIPEKSGPDKGDVYVAEQVRALERRVEAVRSELLAGLGTAVREIGNLKFEPPEIEGPVKDWVFDVERLGDGRYQIRAKAQD